MRRCRAGPGEITLDPIQRQIDAALAAAGEAPQHGWTAEEIRARLIIIVGDMSRESCGQLVEDGWRPALTQETAPGRFRAALLADRTGVGGEEQAGHVLRERLTERYADLPPLAEPAFPAPRLVEMVRRVCAKAAAEIAEIAASLVRGRQADDADVPSDEEIERRGRDGPEF